MTNSELVWCFLKITSGVVVQKKYVYLNTTYARSCISTGFQNQNSHRLPPDPRFFLNIQYTVYVWIIPYDKKWSLRGYWSLELTFLDEKSAEQRNYVTIKISHVVDLALILSKQLVNNYWFRYTLTYVTSTRCPSTKFQNISPPRVYFEISSNINKPRVISKLKSFRSVFFKNDCSFSWNSRKLPNLCDF